MKSKTEIIKKTSLNVRYYAASVIVPVVLTFTACENKVRQDPKEIATEHNDAKFSSAKETDADFLVSAAEINLEEIQLGILAQSKSVLPEVKALGKMMEEEHKKAQKALEDLAIKKQITVPTTTTGKGEDAYKKLNDKTETDFDKDYTDMMVAGHKNAIEKFTKESTEGTDTEIRSWAESMLPALRSHLDHAMSCQKMIENNKSKTTVNNY